MDFEQYGATALVDGRQLTSAYDRTSEARRQIQWVPADAEEVWVYGCGLGDVVELLLQRPAIKRVHVAVLCREIWDALGPLDRISDPRVVVHMPGEVDTIKLPAAVCAGDIPFAEKDALQLRDLLVAALNAPYNDALRDLTRDMRARNEAGNADRVAVDTHVSALFGSETREIAVVAGGPTASAAFGWLKEGGRCVVAVSRALVPLLGAGIVPDVVVIIDPYPGNAVFLPRDERLASSTLVYLPAVEPKAIEQWPGRRLWCDEADFYLGGSVLHAAADLATKMGARTVHLVGADLCFPGDESHVAGATGERCQITSASPKTVDGFGRWVTTQEALMQYHRALEDLVSLRPEVRWVKHDRRGVAVRGAVWFDEAESRAA